MPQRYTIRIPKYKFNCITPQGKILRELRIKHNLTMSELSTKTSVSKDMIKRYEHGKNNFTYKNAIKLASFFNVDEKLFFDEYLWFVYGGIGNELVDKLISNGVSYKDLVSDKWYLYNTFKLLFNKDFNKIGRRSYNTIIEHIYENYNFYNV